MGMRFDRFFECPQRSRGLIVAAALSMKKGRGLGKDLEDAVDAGRHPYRKATNGLDVI